MRKSTLTSREAVDPAKQATTPNHKVICELKVMGDVEADTLIARTKEVVESSEELVRQSQVSIRELKDAQRRYRNLIKKVRKEGTERA